MAGNLLFEAQGSSWVTAYIYFAGALHAQYKNNTTYFVHRDHLGSTRLLTGLTNPSLPVDNLDYLPFGEQIAGDTGTTHKFTGQERDAETGLDYFLARHMAPGLGRFLQPDPGNLGASAGFPQNVERVWVRGEQPDGEYRSVRLVLPSHGLCAFAGT